MLNRGCGDQAVRSVERRSPQLALTIQDAPPDGDGVCDGENAVTKPSQQISVEPLLELGTTTAQGEYGEPLADFTNGDDAEKQGGDRLPLEPLDDVRLGPVPAEFRRDVGVEKVAGHKSTGRPVDELRPKSRLRPRNGAKRST